MKKANWILGALVAGALIATLAGLRQEHPATDGPRLAPDFELPGVADGKPVRLSDHRGKVVLVDFWATWCQPCQKTIPHMLELRKELGPERVEFIGVSVDNKAELVKPFVEKHKISYPVVVEKGSLPIAFGTIYSIPTAFVVDARGIIRQTLVGYQDKETLRAALLAAEKEQG